MATIRCRRTVPVLAVVALLVGSLVAPAGAETEPIVYQPPVEAPVVDGFRAPETRYGPGNRGLTYDLEPGSKVRASADGTVSFSGTVGGTLHVTVAHADGLRTSYSFLTSIQVTRGQRVRAGDVVGEAASGFHFGVRDGGTYLDPAALFGEIEVRVRLVSGDPPPPTAAEVARDRDELRRLVRLRIPERWLLDQVTDLIGSGRDSVGPLLVHLYDAALIKIHAAHDLHQRLSMRGIFDRIQEGLDRLDQECTESDAGVAITLPVPRVAVTVAGYGSDSESAAVDNVDTRSLGYSDDDVVRFSYLGGRVPGSVAADLESIPEAAYSPVDTFADLRQRGTALADLIVAVSERRPGAPIDLYAHSQGGIVTRLALNELAERGRSDVVGVVVTIGSPHGGADLASAGVALSPLGDEFIEALAELAGASVNPDASSVHQMAENSELLNHLAETGIPDDVDFRTIGARGDLIVPASRTTVAGTPAAFVDLIGLSAHDALPGDADTTRELLLALAGMPPSCRGAADVFLDLLIPDLVTSAEDLITLWVPVI